MPKITKRGRGRPARIDRLKFDLENATFEGAEKLKDAYPVAIQLLIDTLKDPKATPTNRISCAKTIKEAAEGILQEILQDEEKDDADSEKESDSGSQGGAVLSLKAINS
jgi:hypothetical protein